MNISIDEKVLKANNYTLGDFLICFAIQVCKKRDILQHIAELKQKGKIFESTIHHHYLYPKTENEIDKIILDSDKNVPKVIELTVLVEKLQELFPKERKPDSNGVPKYAYRGNKRDVTERLQKFFKLYGKYSYDDVLECTRRYVESFKYDKTYMKILPYFIMKDGESQLATELENMDDTPQEINNPNEDWTNTLL